jgi:hypothetical protein
MTAGGASGRWGRGGLVLRAPGAAPVTRLAAEGLEVFPPNAPVPAELLSRQHAALNLTPYHGLRDAQLGGSFVGPHPFLRHAASVVNCGSQEQFTMLDVILEKRYYSGVIFIDDVHEGGLVPRCSRLVPPPGGFPVRHVKDIRS